MISSLEKSRLRYNKQNLGFHYPPYCAQATRPFVGLEVLPSGVVPISECGT